MRMNSRSVAIFAAVVAVLVGFSIYYLNSDWAAHAPRETPEPAAVRKVGPAPSDGPRNDPPPQKVTKTLPKAPPAHPAVTPPPVTEDDLKISAVLEGNTGDTDADHDKCAAQLIFLLPSLSKDGQVECAQHITNLISDAQFSKLMPVWRNAAFNPDVLQVIGDDLNNRANKIKMPAWVDAARNPAHPYHEEAKNNLEVYLDEDYGNNFPKLELAVKAYLEKEAKEEAEAEM